MLLFNLFTPQALRGIYPCSFKSLDADREPRHEQRSETGAGKEPRCKSIWKTNPSSHREATKSLVGSVTALAATAQSDLLRGRMMEKSP